MSDTIYRSDAINIIEKNSYYIGGRGAKLKIAIAEIKALPSADIDLSEYSDKLWKNAYERGKADRPQGEWEIVGKNHPYKRCPFCKRVRAFTDTRFCDWCGARMKGADDE